MTEQNRTSRRLATTVAAIAVVAAAGCTSGRTTKAPVEHRGTVTSGGRSVTTTPRNDGGGIVTNGKDRYVVAEKDDTVASLAARNGLSASELAGYNGLTPDTRLFVGQDLVVPPGAVPNTGERVADAGSANRFKRADDADGKVEERPLSGAGGVAVGEDGKVIDGDTTTATKDGSTGKTRKEGGPRTGWSPDLAREAIARSGDAEKKDETGLKKDGRLGAPPSSTDPVPDAPKDTRKLESPGLSQYQTKASSGERTGRAKRDETDTDVAAADTAKTTGGKTVKLLKPVKGPIAVGFGEGAGAAKNDGVDFAAPTGAPVMAAADGEVALVSETLGGLGTIILVRHKNELLTVYGRVDKVSVKKGDIVRRGQKIGVVSGAGAPAKPRMHFEVRRGATVLDPTKFL